MQIVPNEYTKITTRTATSSANATAVVTLTADPNEFHALHSIQCSYSAAPTAATVTVAIDGTTVFSMHVVGTELVIDLPKPIYGAKGDSMVITLAAGGSGIVGKLNVQTS